jgi:hypothetical protein
MVCSRLPAVYLSSDKIRRERAGILEAVRLNPEEYTPAKRAAVYTELRRRAGMYLEMGESVVMDATFLAPEEREAAADLAIANKVSFWILECKCPVSVIRERLQTRMAGVSDADIEVFESQIRSSTPINLPCRNAAYSGHLLVVNTNASIQTAVAAVIDKLLHGS